MKKVTICASIVCLFLFFWNPGYVYTETAAPSAANTGAPGEQTCNQSNCHVGAQVNLDPGKLTISSLGTPSIANGYVPGTQYNLYVNLNSGTPRYGFQFTALDQNNNAAGTLSLTNVNLTDITTQGGRQYVSHKNAGSTAAWTFRWLAPATDIGEVTFFAAGCGANADNTATGDVIYQGRAVATTSGFSQLNLTSAQPINADEVQALKIFPNPFRERLSVEYFLHDENRVTIELFDMNGKLVKQLDECVELPGFHQHNFAFEEKLTAGIYFLRISEGEKIYFKKLVAE